MNASKWIVLFVLSEGKTGFRSDVRKAAKPYGHIPDNTLRELSQMGLINRDGPEGAYTYSITDKGQKVLRSLLERAVRLAVASFEMP